MGVLLGLQLVYKLGIFDIFEILNLIFHLPSHIPLLASRAPSLSQFSSYPWLLFPSLYTFAFQCATLVSPLLFISAPSHPPTEHEGPYPRPCSIFLHSTSSNIHCFTLFIFYCPQTKCELHEGEFLCKLEVGQTFLNMI